MTDFVIEPVFDEDGVQASSGIDFFGMEHPDSVPNSPPVGFDTGPTLADQVRRMVSIELSRAAADAGYETFEESDDFDIDDDPIDPRTPYEAVFDPPVVASPPESAENETSAKPVDSAPAGPVKNAPIGPNPLQGGNAQAGLAPSAS